MSDITFRRVTITEPAYRQVFELREELLRKPISLSLHDEDLSGEVNDHILVAEENNKILACLILTEKDEQTVQLRQMAVSEKLQGTGVGKRLVAYAEQYAVEKGYQRMVLHARIVAKGFYERSGYNVTSDEFTEVGIPHVVMEKDLI